VTNIGVYSKKSKTVCAFKKHCVHGCNVVANYNM